MKMKRFFALMLALALSLTMLQGVAFANPTYDWDATTKTLTISGNGTIDDKWPKNGVNKADVEHVIIQSGVTEIGQSAFLNAPTSSRSPSPPALKRLEIVRL